MSYNRKALSKAKLDLDKYKKPNPYKKDILYTQEGQWKYPGQKTRIPSSDITMQGVPFPVFAQPNVGQPQMMYPGQEYSFPGASYVDEYPQMKKGGLVQMPKPSKKGLASKKYSRSLSATNKLFTENPLFKKPKSKKRKVFDPNAKYNALTNTISYDPNSPIENMDNDWWREHELFHELQNQAGGLSTSGIMGQRPNPYVASDPSIGSYYDRRNYDVQRTIDGMIAENPELQFIPRNKLAEGSQPGFVGAEELQYSDPSTLEGEAREYEQYIEAGNPSIFPQKQNGGELPEDYQSFLDYSKTAPENRQPSENYYYMSPDEYDHYGMWDALGKPQNFEQALEMNPDWQPDPYDGYYHGFSVNPNTGVFLKSGKPG